MFWRKNGKIITDGNGRPINCAHCPCPVCCTFGACAFALDTQIRVQLGIDYLDGECQTMAFPQSVDVTLDSQAGQEYQCRGLVSCSNAAQWTPGRCNTTAQPGNPFIDYWYWPIGDPVDCSYDDGEGNTIPLFVWWSIRVEYRPHDSNDGKGQWIVQLYRWTDTSSTFDPASATLTEMGAWFFDFNSAACEGITAKSYTSKNVPQSSIDITANSVTITIVRNACGNPLP